MLRITFLLLLSLLGVAGGCASSVPSDVGIPGVPTRIARVQTLEGLGAGQGVAVHGGRVYAFGDAETGVLREYRFVADPWPRLEATGRGARLTVGGVDRINHPTGLAIREGMPTFVGNTITRIREGRIFTIDLERMLATGTADGAILNETLDDAAVQGCRPEYVRWRGRWVVATSDYGPGPNFVRFYDPARLATAARTSEPGVLLAKIPCRPWVQALHWNDATGRLVLVQNQIEGLRWRLTVVSDLDTPSFVPGEAAVGAVRVIDFDRPKDELEGYTQIAGHIGLLLTSSREGNLTFALSNSR